MIEDDLQDDLNHPCMLGLNESLSSPCISSNASRHCSYSIGCTREGTMARSVAADTGNGEAVFQTEYAGVI